MEMDKWIILFFSDHLIDTIWILFIYFNHILFETLHGKQNINAIINMDRIGSLGLLKSAPQWRSNTSNIMWGSNTFS